MRNKILVHALLLAVGVFLAASGSAQQSSTTPKAAKSAKTAKAAVKAAARPAASELEPKALDVLKTMSSRLAAARSMSFTAVAAYESPSRIGPALVYTTVSDVVMQRPDKLRVITPGDGPASEFYYDGKTMTAFAPVENLIAVAAAPPTIDGTLKAAFDTAAIYFPFTDVLVADPYKTISEDLTAAFYIGQSNVIGGTTTDMVAFVNDYVFVQVWIGAEDKLPRMYRAVFSSDPLRLRHQVEISNWKLDSEVAADSFASDKAATAMSIPFAHPNQPPAGFNPPARAKRVAASQSSKPQ